MKDMDGNVIEEGDYVAIEVGNKLCKGKIAAIKPIMDPHGPFQAGTSVQILIGADLPFPAGHFQVPVFLIAGNGFARKPKEVQPGKSEEKPKSSVLHMS